MKKSKTKTVLITDGGGRGAALVDKYGQSKWVGKILVVPGNDLMKINTKKELNFFPHLKTTSVKEILEICKKEKVDLVDVAQDNAVEVGLVDLLIKNGIATLGPTRDAGRVEWDKAWAREFMEKYQIPHPKFYILNSQKNGIDFVKKKAEKSWFVKASGLAEGKGAIPAKSQVEAIEAIKKMSKFGKAGETYLLEEWLIGEEFSAFALCDGEDFVFVGSAQDHKRVNDGDTGLNTGGMGCVSNPLIVDKNIKKQVEEIFTKVVDGLKKENRSYIGVLYLGGIVVEGKSLPAGRQVYVIEFNARWGDPEAQVILPSIKNDLYEVSMAVINGGIKKLGVKTDDRVRVAVWGASRGYPIDYSQVIGKEIFGLKDAQKTKGVKIYGGGVKAQGNRYFVKGGRLFCVMGQGKDVIEARGKAYEAISHIFIEGNNLHYRTDIGWRDVERKYL